MQNFVDLMMQRQSQEDLRVAEWEAVMAGGFGSAAHAQVRREVERRDAANDSRWLGPVCRPAIGMSPVSDSAAPWRI